MRRRVRRRAGLALLLLLSTPHHAFASAAGPALLMSPSWIPDEGHPVPVRVSVEGEPGAAYEVKAWIGDRDRQASRTWNGTDWQRSDWYALEVETDGTGRWTGWVTLRPNPDGAAYDDVVAGRDRTGLWVRVRPADGGAPATAGVDVGVRDAGAVPVRTGAAGEEARYVGVRGGGAGTDGGAGNWSALAPVAPDPRLDEAPADGYYALPAPEEAGPVLALDGAGEVLGPVRDPSPPDLRLVRAVPHAYGPGEPAEAVAVRNAGDDPADLEGVCIEADGAACHRNGTLGPGETVTYARNATAYREAAGPAAPAGAVRPYPPPAGGEPLELPDGAGVVTLTHLGEPVDALVYGDATANATGDGTPASRWEGHPLPPPAPGEVLERVGAGGEALGPDAWEGGRRLGQTDLEPATFAVGGPAWAAVAPGETYDLAASLVRQARSSIQVETYLLTSPSLAAELADALERGVDVSVLVEGSPVGGRPGIEDAILEGLAARGADVATVSSTPTFRARYPALHAKVMVADGERVLVSSENLASTGYPPGREVGNRGWAVAVADRDLATYVGAVLEADGGPSPDVHPVEAGDPDLPPRPVSPPPEPPTPAGVVNATATPVVAPDTTRHPDTVMGLLAGARERVDVQLLSLETRFEAGPNPYVEALLEAARRGVAVRVLLDATYADPATGRLDNDAPRDALEAAAREEGLPLQVRLARGLDVEKVHTKGAVVDGERVLVGSVNWVEAGLDRNREVAVVLDAPAVADRLGEAFEADWRGSLPAAGVVPPAVPGPGVLAAALAAAAAGLVHRRGGLGPGGPRGSRDDPGPSGTAGPGSAV